DRRPAVKRASPVVLWYGARAEARLEELASARVRLASLEKLVVPVRCTRDANGHTSPMRVAPRPRGFTRWASATVPCRAPPSRKRPTNTTRPVRRDGSGELDAVARRVRDQADLVDRPQVVRRQLQRHVAAELRDPEPPVLDFHVMPEPHIA